MGAEDAASLSETDGPKANAVETCLEENEQKKEASLAHRRRLKRILWIALLLLAVDLALPSRYQLSSRLLLTSIDAYQATLSPRMPGMGVHCRFTPTCSHYGEDAIRHHGTARGVPMAVWRILRCGPWTPAGTFDPVVVDEGEKSSPETKEKPR
ncbi:MAG: membrane protein insertion efficiency factor YidD [Acidobacteriota bacterium]